MNKDIENIETTDTTKTKENTITPIPNRLDNELRQIAQDILEEKIFTNRHISPRDNNLIGTIFMVLMFGGAEQIDPDDVGMIFEYYNKACKTAVNGYPIFSSCALLNKRDTKKVWEYYEKFKVAREKLFSSIKLDGEEQNKGDENGNNV